jgi:hypothetical protein
MRVSVVDSDWIAGRADLGLGDGTETMRRWMRFGVLQNEAEV